MKALKLSVLLLLLVSLLSAGCASDKQVISQATQVQGQLKPAIMNDPELSGYLQTVGERIIGSARQLSQQGYGPKSHKSGDNAWMFSDKMQFHLVNSKTVNAFTTGGEHMYIYDALFQMAKSEDELAAVMAHEYGHVYARHVAKGMNRQYGAIAAMVGLGAAGYVAGGSEHGAQYAALGAGLGGAGAQFLNMGFTRGDENEADKLGFDFYSHAGWQPDKFDDFFQAMIDAGYDKTPEIVSDHPSLANRVQETKKRVAALPPAAKGWQQAPVADAAKFRQLQARATQLAKTLPNDQSLAKSQQLARALPRSCLIPYTTKDEVQARQQIVAQAKAKEKKKS
jgi:predicted Zn-dependent protease